MLIVGAGPAGLVMAAVLAAYGVPFRIVDRKSGPVDESRAAIVHVRTLELLDRLGLADRAVSLGVPTTAVEIFQGGRPLGRCRWPARVPRRSRRFRSPSPSSRTARSGCWSSTWRGATCGWSGSRNS